MGLDVISLGELLIDFVSSSNNVSLSASPGFLKAPGGAPANVAAGIAKLGGTSGFIGKVGLDPFGFYLKSVLDDLAVDTSCLAFDEEARTTLSFVALKADGNRDCMFYRHPGADMRLMPEEIAEAYISSGVVFHYGSISLGSESSKAATLKALEYARAHRLMISYDPNLRLDLWRDPDQARKEINLGFSYADIVKISEEEYEFITGCQSAEACGSYILDRGAKLAVVTLGKNGCYYTNGRSSGYVAGFEVNTVETTGAGDAFVAAMLHCFVRNSQANAPADFKSDEDLKRILRFANAAGALATTRIGAIPSLPTMEEVVALLG